MKQYGLNKYDKLCSPTAIDKLFSRGADAIVMTAMAYPLRAVWRVNEERCSDTRPSNTQFLISIPKKRLRHAVDRVAMRRKVREAYRLNRHAYSNDGLPIDLAFVYIANELKNYQTIEKAVCRILQKIYNEKDTEQNSLDTV